MLMYLDVPLPVGAGLHHAPRHDGAPLVGGGPGQAAARRVDLLTLNTTSCMTT